MDPTNTKENTHEERASLYVGNLSLKTHDMEIQKLFQSVGNLRLVKVIRPTSEQHYYKPTCYAYVTYANESDAHAAINKLNFYELHGNQIRVMFCNKNNYKNENANVIIKNLPLEVDDKSLFDTFKIFGRILSAKVAMHNGKSAGYGYIQFADKISAKKCIKLGEGTTMNGNLVKIEKYEKKQTTEQTFTNLYIKNFPSSIKEEELKKYFTQIGEVNSFFMPLKENKEPKGFAFCNYVDSESAKEAIKQLHGSSMFDLPDAFYVQRAQNKNERDLDIRNQLARLSLEGKNIKRNLYVTEIPSSVSEEEIIEAFEKFGKIISYSSEKDAVKSKGDLQFAYICYATPEEAQKALENAPSIVLGGVTPHVVLFKSKRERELERENTSYFYNPSYSSNQRINPYFERRSDYSSESRLYDDLYKQLYSIAMNFEDKWSKLGVKNKAEFASKVSSLFFNKKGNNELRNMIELTNVLLENVDTALKEINEPKNGKKII